MKHRKADTHVADAPGTARAPVAFFLPTLGAGGAERCIVTVARGFSARGIPVDMVVASAIGPNRARIPAQVRLVDLESEHVLASLPRVVRYLRRERPSVIVAALDRACLVALWARRIAAVPTRVVISIRNTLSVDLGTSPMLRARAMLPLMRLFYPKADAIVTVSDGVAADLAQVTRLPAQRIRTIYNPVVTSELWEAANQPLSHPWFGEGQPPVLLAGGRLEEQKDFETLLQAFALVRARRGARLVILGDGGRRADLESTVERLGLQDSVALPGFIDKPFPYMARAAVFVLSSKYEGLPAVLVEALALGTPVVSTNCPSGPREILADGKYGRLVPVGDAPALAASICDALAEGRQPVPREAWGRFQMEHAIDSYLEVVSEATGRRW